MDQPLTPEQNKQLDSWASQRDSLLLDIANKRSEIELLTATNNNLASSNTEISEKVQQSIGRLEELDKKDKERATLISQEIVDLISEKSVLQTEISGLKTEILTHEDKKQSILRDILSLSLLHDKVFEKVNGLESMIGGIVTVSSENATRTNNILIDAATALQKMIDINDQNVAKTNAVIYELPKMIMDLQIDIIERKTLNKIKQK